MFPILTPSERSREYQLYRASIRGRVAFEYLTIPNIGHREIDEKLLGKDPKYTHGYQSMGILHHQGLYKNHRGKLAGKTLLEVINALTEVEHSQRLIHDLNSFHTFTEIDKRDFDKEFERQVQQSFLDSPAKRQKRLALKDSKLPQKIAVSTTAFIRDPDVVAEALSRSKGQCEECQKPAPFFRKSDGSPYLEVHHKVQLSQGGMDTIGNVLALCPNCHRKLHFGQES
jgi:5-methylcytosine-specific restriction protein A